jgi:hypothetical protein
MTTTETAKRHTGFSGAAFRKTDQSPGSEINNNIALVDLQAQRLKRQFGFEFETCVVIASPGMGAGMAELMAHQIATRAFGGEVFVTQIRDASGGPTTYAVAYRFGSAGTKWLSRHRWQDIGQCEAGAMTLSDFLGAEMRR